MNDENDLTQEQMDAAEEYNPTEELYRKNNKDKQKSTITFVGGHVDGEQFDIPQGVNELTVDSPFGPVKYVRSIEYPNTFVPNASF